MTKNDYPQFFQKFKEISGGVYDKPLDASKVKAYWTVLSQLSIEEFITGIDAHALDPKSGQFFPKPADILRNAKPGFSSLQTANEAARNKWLLNKSMEIKTGIAAYCQTDIHRTGNSL